MFKLLGVTLKVLRLVQGSLEGLGDYLEGFLSPKYPREKNGSFYINIRKVFFKKSPRIDPVLGFRS